MKRVTFEGPDAVQAWLDWRREGVGASDVAPIMGFAPSSWGSCWSTWANKLGLLPDFKGTRMMNAGKLAERMIKPYFEQETGLYIGGEQGGIEGDNPIHRTTTDGSVFDQPSRCTHSGLCPVPGHPTVIHGDLPVSIADFDTDEDALVEMKNDSRTWGWDKIPLHYETQGQWQMHVSGLDRVFFAVLHRGWDLKVYELERNQRDIDLMVEAVDRFWIDHVLTGFPPDVDDSEATAKALFAVYPGGSGDAVDLTAMRDTVERWLDAKSLAKSVKATVDELANEIKAVFGNAEEGLIDGQLALSWRRFDKKEYTVKARSERRLTVHGVLKGDDR